MMPDAAPSLPVEYQNPILPGFHPDPSVCRADEDYYLATSTFEYFPGVALFHSTNLADWEPIGSALDRESQLPIDGIESSHGVFAPTIRAHEGTIYLATTLVGAGGNLVVTTDDPTGDWSEPTWVDASGYDPDLFWDDGTTYWTYANDDAIHQCTVDLETGETGEVETIFHGLEGGYTEAPHLYEIDGTYYLIVAEGGTHNQHLVAVARSDEPSGSFEPHPDNPIFSHRSRVMHPIGATGHGDLVRAHDGSWWMTFLGIRQRGEHPPYHVMGRETFLAPVTWEDGWPVVNDGKPVDLAVDVPETDLVREGQGQSQADPAWTRSRDPFARDELGPAWNYRRIPEWDRYRLVDGALELDGGPATLEDEAPTFVGRRQQHHDFAASCTLAFDPGAGEEAGLTAFQNEEHHYDVAVVGRDGERRAIARRRIDGLVDVVVGERSLPDGPVALAIESDDETYRLLAGPAEEGGIGDLEPLGEGHARYLSSEVATGFTGVYLGCYATGNGAECERAARFEDFQYGPASE